MTDDDEADIERVLNGDHAAFRGLLRRHREVVFGLLRQLAPVSDADDLCQDAFVAAFRKLATFDRSRGSFAAWILTIARRLASNARRVRGPEPAEFEPRAPDADSPAREAGDRELFARLDAALERLPDEQRAAFVLAEIHGLAYAEVAAIEGVPVGTVRSRVHRARERLQGVLAGLLDLGARERADDGRTTTERGP